MGVMRKVKRACAPVLLPIYEKAYPSALPGSKTYLIGAELKYGGVQVRVPRNKVSPKDPRTREQILTGGQMGGDRMYFHGYAAKYAEYLWPFIAKGGAFNLAEFGILRGQGLAIWCDLFPHGRVLGFDIDLSNFNDNADNLRSRGAFTHVEPELYEFDQFEENRDYLGEILKSDKINICIDDGFHSVETIMNTMHSVMPYLADEFVYFVEDNKVVHGNIKAAFPELSVWHSGQFTVVTRNTGN